MWSPFVVSAQLLYKYLARTTRNARQSPHSSLLSPPRLLVVSLSPLSHLSHLSVISVVPLVVWDPRCCLSFLRGLPSLVRTSVLNRLAIRKPEVLPDDGYDIIDIEEAVLRSRDHVTTNPRSVTFQMYFPMFLTLSLTDNQSSHLHPSLNVPTMYLHIPCGLHLSQ